MLKVGFGKHELTPPLGIELSGYGYLLGRCGEQVEDPLYVRALSCVQGEEKFLLMNCDLLKLSPWTVEAVKGAFEAWYDIPKKNVLILCIHTHTGPSTTNINTCGIMDPNYTATLAERLIQAGLKALEDAAPVIGMEGSIRELDEPIGLNRANLPDMDKKVKNLVIRRENRSPIAIASYACHPVVCGRVPVISADFCGEVMRRLDSLGYMGIFINGACGDINPTLRQNEGELTAKEIFAKYAQLLLDGFEAGLKPLQGEMKLKSALVDVELPLCDWGQAEFDEVLADILKKNEENSGTAIVARSWHNKVSKLFAPGKPRVDKIQAQFFALGDIVLVAYPYETYTGIALAVSNAFPDKKVICLGNANANRAYVPNRAALEGDITSYGTLGSCMANGKRIPFAPEAPDILVNTTIEALKAFLNE